MKIKFKQTAALVALTASLCLFGCGDSNKDSKVSVIHPKDHPKNQHDFGYKLVKDDELSKEDFLQINRLWHRLRNGSDDFSHLAKLQQYGFEGYYEPYIAGNYLYLFNKMEGDVYLLQEIANWLLDKQKNGQIDGMPERIKYIFEIAESYIALIENVQLPNAHKLLNANGKTELNLPQRIENIKYFYYADKYKFLCNKLTKSYFSESIKISYDEQGIKYLNKIYPNPLGQQYSQQYIVEQLPQLKSRLQEIEMELNLYHPNDLINGVHYDVNRHYINGDPAIAATMVRHPYDIWTPNGVKQANLKWNGISETDISIYNERKYQPDMFQAYNIFDADDFIVIKQNVDQFIAKLPLIELDKIANKTSELSIKQQTQLIKDIFSQYLYRSLFSDVFTDQRAYRFGALLSYYSTVVDYSLKIPLAKQYYGKYKGQKLSNQDLYNMLKAGEFDISTEYRKQLIHAAEWNLDKYKVDWKQIRWGKDIAAALTGEITEKQLPFVASMYQLATKLRQAVKEVNTELVKHDKAGVYGLQQVLHTTNTEAENGPNYYQNKTFFNPKLAEELYINFDQKFAFTGYKLNQQAPGFLEARIDYCESPWFDEQWMRKD